MPQDSKAQVLDAERAELQRVAEAFVRWPRLSQLLRYMGEKLSSGEVEQLNEYNIATEVLGRSKTVFDAGQDAIARVEAHRLRKRLVEFYEKDGKDHVIQVTLPAGSYVPIFIHKPEPAAPAIPPALQQTSKSEFDIATRPPSAAIHHGWKYLTVTVVLVLIALGVNLYFRSHASSGREKSATTSISPPTSISGLPEATSSPIRLLAGYSGPPRTDSAGRIWNPDRYFSGGGSWQRTVGSIGRTSDPFLFEHSRTGDFSYNIPLKPGIYELHLYFSAPNSDTVATFNVAINGSYVLEGFDINNDSLGQDIGDERVFRDVSPDKDGFLRIGFTGALAPPTVNAIEILPGIPHTQLPIRLIMQPTPFTDREGRLWRPDTYFINGRLSTQAHTILDSSDPELFSGERYGHFTYAIPVDTRDTYTVVLHFAELYFGAGASGNGGTGSRVFKVMCNGQTLLDNFDIFKQAGSLHAVAKTFRHLKPTAQGKLNLTFEPILNNATVSGIEVLDEVQ